MANSYVSLDLKQAREHAGYTQGDIASACEVTVRAVQHWEKKKRVRTKYKPVLDKIFHDKAIGWLWKIDNESSSRSPIISGMIDAMRSRDFEKAIMWSERETNPNTGAKISHSSDEETFVSVLRATTFMFVKRCDEAEVVFVHWANKAEEFFKPMRASVVEKDVSKDGSETKDAQPQKLSNLHIRSLIEAKMEAITFQIDRHEISVSSAVDWIRFMQNIVRNIRDNSGATIYIELLGKLLWNQVNTLCTTGDKRDLERTADPLLELKFLYGRKKLLAVIQRDKVVCHVLEVDLIRGLLKAE